jgi:hypothetical protein
MDPCLEHALDLEGIIEGQGQDDAIGRLGSRDDLLECIDTELPLGPKNGALWLLFQEAVELG